MNSIYSFNIKSKISFLLRVKDNVALQRRYAVPSLSVEAYSFCMVLVRLRKKKKSFEKVFAFSMPKIGCLMRKGLKWQKWTDSCPALSRRAPLNINATCIKTRGLRRHIVLDEVQKLDSFPFCPPANIRRVSGLLCFIFLNWMHNHKSEKWLAVGPARR